MFFRIVWKVTLILSKFLVVGRSRRVNSYSVAIEAHLSWTCRGSWSGKTAELNSINYSVESKISWENIQYSTALSPLTQFKYSLYLLHDSVAHSRFLDHLIYTERINPGWRTKVECHSFITYVYNSDTLLSISSLIMSFAIKSTLFDVFLLKSSRSGTPGWPNCIPCWAIQQATCIENCTGIL